MHIAFVLTQSLESPSGLGRYWPIARELVRLGYRVSIIAPHHNFNSSVPLYEVRDGVEIWISGQMHVRKVGSHKEYFSPIQLIQLSLRTAYQTARLIRKIRPDAIHLGKPQPINGAAVRWVLAFNRKLTLYVDCDDYEAESNRTSGKWQRWILAYFEDSLPRLARSVSVNTRFLANRVEGLGVAKQRIHWIPNGVDRARFQKPPQTDRAAEWPGEITTRNKRVLYIGSLDLINHPVDLLLDAFAEVHQAEPLASLLIVGGGNDFDRLQTYARNKGLDSCVRFAGL
ncbi:MAG TPA: glycosyltransferase, partial [Anaerolineae bacterium]|nr:glycosyltransferase [Anaerolineae bacterium]